MKLTRDNLCQVLRTVPRGNHVPREVSVSCYCSCGVLGPEPFLTSLFHHNDCFFSKFVYSLLLLCYYSFIPQIFVECLLHATKCCINRAKSLSSWSLHSRGRGDGRRAVTQVTGMVCQLPMNTIKKLGRGLGMLGWAWWRLPEKGTCEQSPGGRQGKPELPGESRKGQCQG